MAKNITIDHDEREAHEAVAIQPAIGLADALAEQQQDHRAEQRQRGHDPDQVEEIARAHEVAGP